LLVAFIVIIIAINFSKSEGRYRLSVYNSLQGSIGKQIEGLKDRNHERWKSLLNTLPRDSLIMKECLERLNKKYPYWCCNVEYHD